MIETIDFATILPIWRQELWPGRVSAIEPVSAIDIDGEYNMALMQTTPFFWGAFSPARELWGVVSGFQTSPQHFRSRGIWVHPQQRAQGMGSQLLQVVEQQALKQGCHILWTMPRKSSWDFYQKLGFHSVKEVTQFEFGPHYIAIKNLSEDSR